MGFWQIVLYLSDLIHAGCLFLILVDVFFIDKLLQ